MSDVEKRIKEEQAKIRRAKEELKKLRAEAKAESAHERGQLDLFQ
jgi:hypothetical protein